MRKQSLFAKDWDTLIILDACRYDFFEKVYRDYFDGRLEKRISPGSCTGEWLVKSFPGKYDITYISANPHINSYGIPLKRWEKYNYSWKAAEHFSKIIDVWKFGWDENLETVLPKTVNEACLSNQDGKKTIVHYIQPHTPYLSLDLKLSPWRRIRYLVSTSNTGKEEHPNKMYLTSFRKLLGKTLIMMLGTKGFWRMRKLLGLQPLTTVEWFWRRGDIDEIFYYYEDNLRQVLDATRQLIERTNGKIIVTADHGEALGEQGIWGHPHKVHIPVLVEIPWFEVKRVNKK